MLSNNGLCLRAAAKYMLLFLAIIPQIYGVTRSYSSRLFLCALDYDCWLWVSVGCVALVHPEFVVHRAEKFGGTVRFTTYHELAEAYAKEEVYPLDLKNAVAAELNKVSCSLIPKPL